MKKVLSSVLVIGVMTVGVFTGTNVNPVTTVAQGTGYETNNFPIQPPVVPQGTEYETNNFPIQPPV